VNGWRIKYTFVMGMLSLCLGAAHFLALFFLQDINTKNSGTPHACTPSNVFTFKSTARLPRVFVMLSYCVLSVLVSDVLLWMAMKKMRNRVVPLGLQTTRAVRDLRSSVSTLAVMLAWNTISLAPMTLTMVVIVLGLPLGLVYEYTVIPLVFFGGIALPVIFIVRVREIRDTVKKIICHFQ